MSSLSKKIIRSYVSGRVTASAAADSFPAYLKLCGRAEDGTKLKLDQADFDCAKDMERAYREKKDYFASVSRGGRKTTRNLAFAAWLIGRDPDFTIIYITHIDDLAHQRNRWLQAILRSRAHASVFPNAVLRKKGSNAGCTIVTGKTDDASPNILAMGIDGARAGYHVKCRIVDDVCDPKSSLTQPARKSIIKEIFYTSSGPTLDKRTLEPERAGVGMTIFTGTPYATDDLNAEVEAVAKIGTNAWVYNRIACGGPLDGFHSPFPGTYSPADLKIEHDRNPRAYGMNYELRPLRDSERPFRSPQYYLDEQALTPQQIEDLGGVPPMLSYSDSKAWQQIMAVDPGFVDKKGSSCTGINIGVVGPDHIYVPFCLKVQQAWDLTVHRIPEIYKEFGITRFLVEEAAQQIALQTHFRDLGIPYVESAKTGNLSKEIRAQDVAPAVNSGRVLLRGRLHQSEMTGKWEIIPADSSMETLRDDLLSWPGVLAKDLVDSFVYMVQACCEMGRPSSITAPPMETMQQERTRQWKERMFGVGNTPDTATPEWRVYAGQN